MNRKNKLFFCAALFVGLLWAGVSRAETVSFSLRYQDQLMLDSVSADLPAADTVTISSTDGVGHGISSQSVLGVLSALDRQNTSFEISNLVYYPSFNSLYVKCVKIVLNGVNACDNWQYAVNESLPYDGMDAHILHGGDKVFLFFGNSHQVSLRPSEVFPDEQVTATARQYHYQDNTWQPLTGVTIGVTAPNPNDPSSPMETATRAVDGVGNALFSLSDPGSYGVGIKEDWYFPTIPLVVQKRGGGGATVPSPVAEKNRAIDTAGAVQFLASQQEQDGSFMDNAMITDWAAVAFGGYGDAQGAREKVKTYLLGNPDPGSLPTDYERRAMALMSLGIDPYRGIGTDYIGKIASAFDGTQIGDLTLVNDDVFGLLVLEKAGYQPTDEIIAKTTNFILARQDGKGSWGGVDMTAAAVQALSLERSDSRVQVALARAKTYLADQQSSTGGFANDPNSTAWALGAIAALGESDSSWQKGGKTGGQFLANAQSLDGGFAPGDTKMNRVWLASYAIPAALGKSWGSILASFSKPVIQPQSVQPTQLLSTPNMPASSVSDETAPHGEQVAPLIAKSGPQEHAESAQESEKPEGVQKLSLPPVALKEKVQEISVRSSETQKKSFASSALPRKKTEEIIRKENVRQESSEPVQTIAPSTGVEEARKNLTASAGTLSGNEFSLYGFLRHTLGSFFRAVLNIFQ